VGFSKNIYDRSPVWLQNFMVSLQGIAYNHRRWNVRYGLRLLAGLRESQWWTSEQFLAYQNERLRRHIAYAAANIPYYGELFRKEGIDPAGIRTVEDLRKLPLLEKDVVRSNPNAFLRGGHPLDSWNRLFTSGTTGSPMELYSSRESFSRVWSFVFRLREWAGMRDPIYPRRAQFTGRDIVPDRKIKTGSVFWRRNIPGNSLLMSTSHLTADTVPAYVEAMKRFRPALVDGYPSAIVIVARVARSLDLDLPRPLAAITSAETLLPEDRRDIEQAFGCKVFDQYASSDTGAFICNCEQGSLHVNPEFGICEILRPDGLPAEPGEEGEIVTTSFCNKEQVFIRYRIGDTAVAGPLETCSCGRAMPMVEALTGRLDDTLFIPDRGFVGRFDPIFKSLTGMYEAQIIHESLNHLRVILVPDASYDPSAGARLEAAIRTKVGDTIGVTIEAVKEIPRGPNGKFRSVISKCRDRYPST
jgi:phenylacetate-CoA ligase